MSILSKTKPRTSGRPQNKRPRRRRSWAEEGRGRAYCPLPTVSVTRYSPSATHPTRRACKSRLPPTVAATAATSTPSAMPPLTAPRAYCPEGLAGQDSAPPLNTRTLEYPGASRVSPDEGLTTSQGPAEAHGGGREHGASLCWVGHSHCRRDKAHYKQRIAILKDLKGEKFWKRNFAKYCTRMPNNVPELK